jgi:DNA-directed RNA polymerase sigma subunit (sigma70/sigma32)
MVKNEEYDSNKITLQDIGDIFKVTRMRICQIEKNAIKKLKDRLAS